LRKSPIARAEGANEWAHKRQGLRSRRKARTKQAAGAAQIFQRILSGGKQNAWTASDSEIVEASGEEDTDELCDASEEKIGLRGEHVGSFSTVKTQAQLEL